MFVALKYVCLDLTLLQLREKLYLIVYLENEKNKISKKTRQRRVEEEDKEEENEDKEEEEEEEEEEDEKEEEGEERRKKKMCFTWWEVFMGWEFGRFLRKEELEERGFGAEGLKWR